MREEETSLRVRGWNQMGLAGSGQGRGGVEAEGGLENNIQNSQFKAPDLYNQMPATESEPKAK